MRKSNIILDKTFNFSIQIVELYKLLLVKHRVYDLARQVLKSGTSIGANAEEAVGGISKKDFRSKFSISLKEARETKYWLKLLHKTHYIDFNQYQKLEKELIETIKILTSIVKTSEKKN